MSDWAGSLQHLRQHLDQLQTDEQRERVAERHRYLIRQASENLALLESPSTASCR